MAKQSDPMTLWRAIVQAGGVQAYVQAQLEARGFLVKRRDVDKMSDHERESYKKSLKAEAEEKRTIRREAWRAYRANHLVHLGEGIHWSDKTMPDKWDAPNAESRASENELPAIDNPEQLAEQLGLTIPQLRWLAFHRDVAKKTHYVPFTIPKRDGTPRPIWAPRPILKKAQRWIARNIVERLAVHGASHGFLPGRSILTNASVHRDSRIILKMDIEGFFPTVTFRRVKGLFRKAGYREQVATLLALLCTESPREIVEHEGETLYVALGPRCLPQGAPTSPSITNTLCMPLDRRLAGIARKLGWRYTRYADDLTFSLPEGHKDKPHLGTLIGVVTRIVEAEGFKVKASKTRVARSGGRQRVTGLMVNGDHPPRVSRAVRRQLRAAIHNASKGKPLREGEGLSHLEGMAAFVKMSDPALGRKLLDQVRSIRPEAIS